MIKGGYNKEGVIYRPNKLSNKSIKEIAGELVENIPDLTMDIILDQIEHLVSIAKELHHKKGGL